LRDGEKEEAISLEYRKAYMSAFDKHDGNPTATEAGSSLHLVG
jgi:hypothetical protein